MVYSLSDSSQQYTVHIFYFHVIFISSNSVVRVKIYAYIEMITNKLTHYFPERKAIAESLQLREADDSFGKGFHVLNCLMTGRCPRKSCSYGRSSTRFFSKIASIFKKVLHLTLSPLTLYSNFDYFVYFYIT